MKRSIPGKPGSVAKKSATPSSRTRTSTTKRSLPKASAASKLKSMRNRNTSKKRSY